MSRTVRGWALLVAAGALFAPQPGWAADSEQQAALPAVRLVKLQFDPPGDDEPTNSQLNKEWVQVRNFSARTRNIGGWSIRDRTGFKSKFPVDFTIAAGATVTVHTGSGTQRALHRYWGQGTYVWNNDGDKATLKNAGGTVIDTCAYDGTGAWISC
jgi:hypothetical protein